MQGISKVDKFGRILLPQAVRLELNLKPGSEIVFSYDEAEGRVELSTRRRALQAAQAEFASFKKAGRLLSDELIEERRKEAEKVHSTQL